MSAPPTFLSPEDRLDLQRAYASLEHPGFAIRLSNFVGMPIEQGFKLLPRRWHRRLHHYAEQAMWRALEAAVHCLKDKKGASSDRYYRFLGTASGAVGGFIGGPALLLELPFTTTVMLRAIADIARSQGEDLDDLETRMACLEVFALGGHAQDDDAADTGYYSLRLALEAPIAGASRYIAQNGAVRREGAPALVNTIVVVSRRFGVTLSEKAAAEIVPVIGAVGGAAINRLFVHHFQDVAHGHFTIRRLERKYGTRLIRAEYRKLAAPAPKLLFAPA